METMIGILLIIFLISLIFATILGTGAKENKTSFKKMWISIGIALFTLLLALLLNSKANYIYIKLNKSTVTLNKNNSASIKVKTNPNAKIEVLDPDNDDMKLSKPKSTNKGSITITVDEEGGYKLKVIKNNHSKTKKFHVKPHIQSEEEAEASYKSSSSEKASYEAAESSESLADASSKAASESAESSSIASESSSEAASENPDTYSSSITYDQVARDPKTYAGKDVEFTGKVLQVIEDKKITQLRLAVNGNYDNVILVEISNKLLDQKRILENDLITVGGMSDGTVSYESALGSEITIPSMLAFGINDKGTASDEYGE